MIIGGILTQVTKSAPSSLPTPSLLTRGSQRNLALRILVRLGHRVRRPARRSVLHRLRLATPLDGDGPAAGLDWVVPRDGGARVHRVRPR